MSVILHKDKDCFCTLVLAETVERCISIGSEESYNFHIVFRRHIYR